MPCSCAGIRTRTWSSSSQGSGLSMPLLKLPPQPTRLYSNMGLASLTLVALRLAWPGMVLVQPHTAPVSQPAPFISLTLDHILDTRATALWGPLPSPGPSVVVVPVACGFPLHSRVQAKTNREAIHVLHANLAGPRFECNASFFQAPSSRE